MPPQLLKLHCLQLCPNLNKLNVLTLQHALLALHGNRMGNVAVRGGIFNPLAALVRNAQSVGPPKLLQPNAHPPRTLCVVRTSIISIATGLSSSLSISL